MNREVISDGWQRVSRILKQSVKSSNACLSCGNTACALICHHCESQIGRFSAAQCDNEHVMLNSRPDVKRAVPLLLPYKMAIIGPHEGLLRQCISTFKYRNKPALAGDLAALFSEELKQHYHNEPLPDAIAPVPVHPWKLARRGYNQTVLIGESLQKSLSTQLLPNLFISRNLVKAQVRKGGNARRELAYRQFSVNQIQALKHICHIALFDDVITTGSTMLSLIRALETVNPNIRIDLWSLSISLPRS